MRNFYLLVLVLFFQAMTFQTLNEEKKINFNPDVNTALASISDPSSKHQKNENLNVTVTCMVDQASPYAVPFVCTSQMPLPIKIYTSFKMWVNGIYWSGQSDWYYEIRDANEVQYFFPSGACSRTQTPAGVKNYGDLIEIWLTCFTVPKILNFGDHMHIFALMTQDMNVWLGYSIPIPGFSTQQSIRSLSIKQRKNFPKRPRKITQNLVKQTQEVK